MIVAILDIGTNTFNLLIAEINGKDHNVIFRSKIPVKLGQDTINEGTLNPDAIKRGLNALITHKKTIEKYNTDKIYAFATSAVRSASNGNRFIQSVYEQTEIDIKVISGDREAEFIWLGAKQHCPENENTLIMDIGGGSIEFIICNRKNIFWKKSYQLGIARLLERFKPSDPISESEIKKIRQYFLYETPELFKALNKYPAINLLGTSGSFETLAQLIKHNTKTFSYRISPELYFIHLPDFRKLHDILLQSKLDERKQMKGMEIMRAEMMVIASITMNVVIQTGRINSFYQTKHALREGVMETLKTKYL